MPKQGVSVEQTSRIKHYSLVLVVVWTCLIALSATWIFYSSYNSLLKLARTEAQASFNKDLVYRRWAALHGGVYVPVTDTTLPNPYLNVPEREITTLTGRELTLINPAYMTRQVHELGQQQYGARGHITSLNPLRPENAPDPWEAAALQAFEEGAAEISSVEIIDGQSFMRYMHVMLTEESCLKCHAEQGYSVGDIRGGISVSVPVQPYWAAERPVLWGVILGHCTLWLVGMAGLWLARRRMLADVLHQGEVNRSLWDSAEQYRVFTNTAMDGFSLVDLEGRLQDVNDTYCQMTGYSRAELLTMSISDLDVNQTPENNKVQVERVIENGSDRFETRHRCKDGHFIDVEVSTTFIPQSNQFLTFLHDITQRKKIETTLRESEAIHRNLLANLNAGVIVHAPDTAIMLANPAACEMLRLTEAQMLGKEAIDPAWHFLREDGSIMPLEEYPVNQVIAMGDVLRNLVLGVVSKGVDEVNWALVNGFPLINAAGELEQVIINFVDITERRQAEVALQDAKDYAENIIQTANAIVVGLDMDGDVTVFNDAAEQITGYTYQELVGRNWFEVLVPRDRYPQVWEVFKELNRGQLVRHFENPILTKAGEERYIVWQNNPITESGQIIGSISFGIDITDRKQMEVALRESEMLYRQMFMNNQAVKLLINPDTGAIIEANPAAEAFYGYPMGVLTTMSIADLNTLSEADVLAEMQLAKQEKKMFFQFRHKLASGETRDVEVHSGPLDMQGTRVLYSIIIDVTARKRAEAALRESEQRYRAVVEASPTAISVMQDGIYIFTNSAGAGMMGYANPLDVIGLSSLETIAPEYHAIIHNRIERLSAGEANTPLEMELLRPDGSRIFIESTSVPIIYQGAPATLLIGQDITERRRSARLLQIRLRLSEFALTHSLYELVRKILDELEFFTGSHIGFFHFVNESQKTLQLQAWSTNTVQNMYSAENEGLPYSIDDVEVWGEAIQARRPIIHNDYASLPHRQGGADGQSPITRILVIPVFQDDLIVAILGVGNKLQDYTETDMRSVTQLAYMAWDIIQRKQAEDVEREQRALATALARNAEVINSILDMDIVIKRILHAVADVVPHDGSNIMLLTEDRTGIRIAQVCECYATNELEEPVVGSIWALEGFPHFQQMLETCEAVVIPNTESYDAWVDMEFGIRSYVSAPIVRAGQVIGFVNVDSLTPNFFTAKHAEHLKAFANQAAIAISNAQMFQQVASYNENLERAVIERTIELTAANEELARLSRAKDEFVSNVSHELRTPITGMRLHQYLLRKRPDRMDQYLGVIERETQRLEHTIEDLLRLSRLDQGRIDVTMDTVDLTQLVTQFVIDRTLPAEELGLTLLCVPVGDSVLVQADQGLLGQVLSILLTNAFNYTPSGGQVTVSTHTRSEEAQSWAGFGVHDTGPGIDPDEQTQLFERFYRGTVGQKSRVHGTGLGLAIARSIIDLHKGYITVESSGIFGEGTTFTVWLPAGPDPET